MIRIAMTALAFGLMFISPSFAKQPIPLSKITIKPEGKMSIDLKNSLITFYDNVVMRDGEHTLKCQKLVAHLKQGVGIKQEFDSNSVEKIKAHGTVSIQNKDMKIEADMAVYDLKTQEIVFTGKPAKVTSGENIVASTRITYNRKEDRIDVDPNGLIEIDPQKLPAQDTAPKATPAP